jgi:hypothetical protein
MFGFELTSLFLICPFSYRRQGQGLNQRLLTPAEAFGGRQEQNGWFSKMKYKTQLESKVVGRLFRNNAA